jgi:phage FluMu protein Com
MSGAIRKRYLTPSADQLHRLRLSQEEAADLQLREIHCPFCNFLIDKVFSDATGHKMITCRKCKEEYTINLGYFRKIKRWLKYDGFHHQRQRR